MAILNLTRLTNPQPQNRVESKKKTVLKDPICMNIVCLNSYFSFREQSSVCIIRNTLFLFTIS